MAKCEYKKEYWHSKEKGFVKYKCPHNSIKKPDDNGKKYCIFHSRQDNKKVNKFYKEFKKKCESGDHEFIGFIFPKSLDFENLRVEIGGFDFKNANFWKAEFMGDADLMRSSFFGKTDFRDVIFNGVAIFLGTVFYDNVNFNDATFSDGANFWGTIFIKNAYFGGATFSRWVDFYDAKFFREAYFGEIILSKEVNVFFTKKIFEDKSKAIFSNFYKFGEKANLTFDGVNLKNVRFNRANVEKINFKEVFWRKSRGFTRRNMLFDESFQTGFFKRLLKKTGIFYKDKENEHYEVQNIYNQLRLNYEKTGRYHEAGDFFVGAMEMRKKGTRESIITRLMLFFYKYISLYGEQPIMAFLWILLTPFLFIPLYLLSGLKYKDPSRPLECNFFNIIDFIKNLNWEDIVNTFYFSLSNLALGKYLSVSFDTGLVPLSNITNFVILLENVCGLLFITLFLLAMNRKFRRTKD
ncbi:MAG: pentapeptide repeat-containing protein [Deltaproteobacteria bacterium]|uniref:Pentapeptide repeat-containing protein n=1 Tax=Candidatus Zymogenus saltonus TaxID=2844893 RepID=A0A9D8KFE5_9DELT|nr:pentapeptide repeat-containing protein [Candidatus Zymogenus saltonus]